MKYLAGVFFQQEKNDANRNTNCNKNNNSITDSDKPTLPLP